MGDIEMTDEEQRLGPRGHADRLLRLVRRAQAGDPAALGEVLSMEVPRVRMMVAVRKPLRMEEQRREDIVQDVMVALAQGIPRIKLAEIAEWNAWVSRVTENKCVDAYRRERLSPEVGLEARMHRPIGSELSSVAGVWNVIASAGPTPSSYAARRETLRILIEELGQMSENHRQAIVLAFVDGLNTTEIGKRVGIARTAAANRVVRALAELERRWKQRMRSPSPGSATTS